MSREHRQWGSREFPKFGAFSDFPAFTLLARMQESTAQRTTRETPERRGDAGSAEFAERQSRASTHEEPDVETVEEEPVAKRTTAAETATDSRPAQSFFPDDSSFVSKTAASSEASVDSGQKELAAAAADALRHSKKARADSTESQPLLRSKNLVFLHDTTLQLQEEMVGGNLHTTVYSLPRRVVLYEGGLGKPIDVWQEPLDPVMDKYIQMYLDCPDNNPVSKEAVATKASTIFELRPQRSSSSWRQLLRRLAFRLGTAI